MKLLIPAWSFYPSQEGGPSNALYWLASGLARAGYEVRVVATNRCLNSKAIVENTWIRLNGFDVIYADVELYHTTLANEIKKCDVVIANGVCTLSGFIFKIRVLCQGKKLILSPRGELLSPAIYHKGTVYGVLKKCMFYLMRLAYGQRVLYHATSEEEYRSIKSTMGKKARIVLIPNYMILPERVEDGYNVYLPQYFLYVGRINQIKNLDILIDALSKSKFFTNSDLKLLIAGEKKGDYYNALVDKVEKMNLSNKVCFLGMVEGKEKDRLFAKAKCLFLLSKSENFGNVIIEALSQGTPVIASKGTPWQRLEETNAGFWINAESDIVATRIDELLSMSVSEYVQMRNSAYMLSREFDIYSNIGVWKSILDDMSQCI